MKVLEPSALTSYPAPFVGVKTGVTSPGCSGVTGVNVCEGRSRGVNGFGSDAVWHCGYRLALGEKTPPDRSQHSRYASTSLPLAIFPSLIICLTVSMQWS